MKPDKGKCDFSFDILFYANPDPMWIFDTDTLQILEVNAAAIKQYGYSYEEFLSLSIKDLRPVKDHILLEKILPSLKSNDTNRREFIHLTKGGSTIHVDIISYKIVFEGLNARLVHAHNVNDKKAMAGKLKFTQDKLMQILETTTIGFIQLDTDWKVTYWNKAAEDLIGYARNFVLGKNLWKILPEIQYSDFHAHFNIAMNRRKSTDFVDYFWPMQKWFSCYAYPVEDGIIVHFRDITNKKLAQEGLLEKIEQLKEVSYLNSHAIRKPIASLMGLTSLFKEQLIKEEELHEVAQLIYDCSVELDEVVKEVNEKVSDANFAMPSNVLDYFDFNEFLHTVVQQAQSYSPKHRIVIEQSVELTFYGNKKRIENALKYLIINAIKYSPGADTVVVSTEIYNQNLILSIKDFGYGMTEQQIDLIFTNLNNRLYQHKERNGLCKVVEVCHRHHGSMWIESKPQEGSVFSLRFPLSNLAMFKVTGQADLSIYHDEDVEVKHLKSKGYLSIKWKGFQNLHTVKAGCQKIFNVMQKTKCYYFLNDNSQVLGPWDDASDWLVKEWFPKVQKAGLKCLAWIYSPSTFSKLSAYHTVELLQTNICVKGFTEKKEAVKWLSQTVELNNVTVSTSG